MKLGAIAIATGAIFLFCGRTVRAADLTEGKSDLVAVQSEIQAAQTEDAKCAGGLVKTLIVARIAILRQTEAMLQQKLVSLKLGGPVRYTVDGKAFSLPASANQMLADVETEIAASERNIQRQEAEVARFSGGLAQAMSLATLETMRQTHAMLEQKRVSLKYGLPQYLGFIDASSKQALPVGGSPDTRPSREGPAIQQPADDDLRKVIALSVVEKGFIPSNPSAGQYQDLMTIKCSYENVSEKDIRAFTGTVFFQDLFGREIYKAGITISDPIGAGMRATWDGTIKYNQFVDALQRFRGAELRDMKVVWSPASVIFSDAMRAEERPPSAMKAQEATEPKLARVAVEKTPAPSAVESGTALVATRAQYDQISTGMTYGQVYAIIGAPGTEISRSRVGRVTAVMYQWKNSDGSNITTMFQNERLLSKAQSGLR